MNKNLVLVQNGYPHSTISGTEVDSLDITNFFKFEKNVVPTIYALYSKEILSDNKSLNLLSPFNENVSYNAASNTLLKTAAPSAWYEKDAALKYNKDFKHYSITFLLFAVRMQKGFLGTDVTITSRLAEDSPLKLRFYDIGDTLEDFKNMNNILKNPLKAPTSGWFYGNIYPHRPLSNALSIPTLNQYNHCFLAALFSDSAYLKESGTKLLNNEPLLNISWTETAFTTEG